jgi:hypothetical protein
MNTKVLKELFWKWSETHDWQGFDKFVCNPLAVIQLVEQYHRLNTHGYNDSAAIAKYMMNRRKRGEMSVEECPRHPAHAQWQAKQSTQPEQECWWDE